MAEVAHLHQMIDALYELSESGQDPFVQNIALGGLRITEEALRSASKTLSDFTGQDMGMSDDENSLVTPESLQEMAAIASEFDKSGDPMLMKQAAVLDEILLTIGADKTVVSAIQHAQDKEIVRLRSLAEDDKDNPYTSSKKIHDKSNHVAEAQKEIGKIKEYRPLEAPLNTRTCPDHPGAQMARIAEHTYQCSLDKGVYNYENGYTTMKGNVVPGGTVSNQTQDLYDRPNEFTSFETRESKLNSN